MKPPKRESTMQAIIGLALLAAGLLMAWKAMHPEPTWEATQRLIQAYEDRAHG